MVMKNKIRWALNFSFIYFFVILLIYKNYIAPFELYSDFLEYEKVFNEGGLWYFGTEVVIPFYFLVLKKIGLDYRDSIFLIGILYIYPIVKLSKNVDVKLLFFYFLFFLIFFVPSYAFLMRQYLAFFLIILFFLSDSRYRYIYLIIGFFSHLSLIYMMIFSLINSKILPKILIFVFIFVAIFNGISLIDILFFLSKYSIGYDLERKVIGQIASVDIGRGSYLVALILFSTIIIHIFFIKNVNHKIKGLMNIFLYSSIFSLIAINYVVISNRVGFAGYFFSIPYLMLVLSQINLSLKMNFK